MATAQKRGFRFPWGGDGGHDEPDATGNGDSGSPDEPTLKQRLETASDDLGGGPFDLKAGGASEARDGDDAAGETADDPADALAVAREEDDVTQLASAAPTARPVPASAAAQEPPHAGAGSTPTATKAADAADPAGGPGMAWPDADWRSERRALPPKAASGPGASAPRRDNVLVTGLIRAMREAARTTRDEAVTSLRAAAAERSQAMRAQSTTSAANLRTSADGDVAAIREWSKAEMARVREETEARIADRRARLVTETEDEANAVEARLAALAESIQQYESETAEFFEALLAEEDPARLAGLAERMPPPPPLDDFAETDPDDAAATSRSRASRSSTRANDASAAAPARRGRLGSESTDADADADASLAPEDPREADAAIAAHETARVQPDADALDPDAAAAAEAEALAGLGTQTQMIVSGLTSVASIATFKAALIRSSGVNAVSVTAGSDGDCLFTVTHAGDADLRHALRDLEPFQTRLIADDGSTLVVVAHEPAA